MIANPGNPGLTGDATEWILRRKRSMQNSVYPGRTPVPLSTTNPTVLSYCLVIHDGSLEADEIDSIAADFSKRLGG